MEEVRKKKNAPVGNFFHVLLQLLLCGVCVQRKLQSRRRAELNHTDSDLGQEGEIDIHLKIKYNRTGRLYLWNSQTASNLVWSNVERLTEFERVVFGPFKAAFAHAVGTIHEEEDVHCC